MWPPHKAFNISFDEESDANDDPPIIKSPSPYNYVLDAQPRYVYPSPITPEQPSAAMNGPMAEEDDLFQSMLTQNKMPLLYEAFEKEAPLPSASPPSCYSESENEQKTLHLLFKTYLGDDFLAHFRLDFAEIYETVCERAKPHKDEVERDKPQIETIIDTFIRRMVLNMLAVDKASLKADEMIGRIEALYYMRLDEKKKETLVPRVKNDYAHYDYIVRTRLERERVAQHRATDPVFTFFSEPKKRGRHSKNRVEEVWNEIETIASHYITSKKMDAAATTTQKSSVVDFYPIFETILATLNRSIPTLANHGWYLEHLLRAIRSLDAKSWPLHGLMSLLHNANYVIHAKRVVARFDRTKQRLYCCFSGLEIKNGETVTWIKVVENDAERLKAAREHKILLGRPFDAPEFRRSVASFYMKTDLCCPISLFYAPFSDAYKARFATYFAPKPITLDLKRKTPDTPPRTPVSSPVKKRTKKTSETPKSRVNTHPFAQVMLHLARLFDHGERWIHVESDEYRRNYETVKTSMIDVFRAMTNESFVWDLQALIRDALVASPYFVMGDQKEQATLVGDMLFAILDFYETIAATSDETCVLAERLAFLVGQRKTCGGGVNQITRLIDEKDSEALVFTRFPALRYITYLPLFFLVLMEYLFAREIADTPRLSGERLARYNTLLTQLHLSRK